MATDSQTPGTSSEKPVPGKPEKKLSVSSVLVPAAVVLAGVLFTLSYLRDRGRKEDSASAASASVSGGLIPHHVGDSIPEVTFRTLDGKSVKLSDLNSKVTLINFWATWCGPCVRELPSLQKLSNKYSSRGLAVIGVNLDDDPETILKPFLEKHEIKYRSFVDPTGELANRFSVSGLPLTLVVDSNRKILLEQLGDEEWFAPELRKQFELWLSGTNRG